MFVYNRLKCSKDVASNAVDYLTTHLCPVDNSWMPKGHESGSNMCQQKIDNFCCCCQQEENPTSKTVGCVAKHNKKSAAKII